MSESPFETIEATCICQECAEVWEPDDFEWASDLIERDESCPNCGSLSYTFGSTAKLR